MRILCSICLLLCATAALGAAPPERINYQGVLRDNTDRPLSGTYGMVFRLFDAATAGTEILVDTHQASNGGAVSVTNGLFNAEIGSGAVTDGTGAGSYTSLTKVFGDYATVWLEVQVGSEVLAPRTRLAASGYALNAGSLAGMRVNNFVDTTTGAQSKTGELTINTVGLASPAAALTSIGSSLGLQAEGNPTAGRFLNRSTNTETLLGTGSTGVKSTADLPGQFVQRSNSAARALLADTTFGIDAVGITDGGKFDSLARNAQAFLGRNSGIGIETYGTNLAARFNNSLGGPVVSLASLNYGARFATLPTGHELTVGGTDFAFDLGEPGGSDEILMGGSSTMLSVMRGAGSIAKFRTLPNNSVVDIHAEGMSVGAHSFIELGGTTGIDVASQVTGIYAEGDFAGGHFLDTTSGNFARVGYNTTKITGNGGVSFIQNHPFDSSKVIVYTAPEGDEVAVYTRGTARLINGEATVTLGETFPLVSNPDVGITAYVTPLDVPIPLAVVSKGTDQIVVRGPSGSNAEFDYIVWGLRIGFEQTMVIEPKELEAPIPSMARHEQLQADDPALRAANALERFRKMQPARVAASGQPARAEELMQRIGVFEPSQLDALRAGLGRSPRHSQPPESGAVRPTVTERESKPQATDAAPAETVPTSPIAAPFVGVASTLLPVSGVVEFGEVVAANPDLPGSFELARSAASPHVVGIAASSNSETGQVVVALSGLASCKVDASYAPVKIGDLLSTSPTVGHAMRASEHAPGTIIAKALEPIEVGTGTIRVLIMSR